LIPGMKSYECFDHAQHERKISNDLKSIRSSAPSKDSPQSF
jgi:hypothetical protein